MSKIETDRVIEAFKVYLVVMRCRGIAQVMAALLLGSLVPMIETQVSASLVLASPQPNTLVAQKKSDEKRQEAIRLQHLGVEYKEQGEPQAALKVFDQAIDIFREIGDRQGEADTLSQMGWTYNDLQDYETALEHFQAAYDRFQELGNRKFEGGMLYAIGDAYNNLGEYTKSISYSQKALMIQRDIRDRQGESYSLTVLGYAHTGLGQYGQAIEFHKQSLVIQRELGMLADEGSELTSLAILYHNTGQYEQSLDHFEQSLAIHRQLEDRETEAFLIKTIGFIYKSIGKYEKGLRFYEDALEIAKGAGDSADEASTLSYIGNLYYLLGDYKNALRYYQNSLSIHEQLNDQKMAALVLSNIGNVYSSQSKYQEALANYEKSLPFIQELNIPQIEGSSLQKIGDVYRELGQLEIALNYLQQATEIFKQWGTRQRLGRSLKSIGKIYGDLGQYAEASSYLQQALAIQQEIGDVPGTSETLSNLAQLFENQNQPELAIAFYKQSVNSYESIRQNIKTLDFELQQFYTDSIADTYRALADLLLSQGRVLEAQQVLELLKIQELRDYTQDTRAGGPTGGSPLTPPEAAVIPSHSQLISLGAKLTACESQKPYCPERKQLQTDRKAALATFNQKTEDLRLVYRRETTTDPALLEQGELTRAAQKLIKAHPNAVLIYPLVLEDKLWLVWGAQAGKEGVVFDSKEIPVSRKDLSTTVAQFRTLLEQRGDEAELKRTGQQLYNWLIAPIRPELDANGIDRLIFSLDRATRYIPMAALHDGGQYLLESFTTSTILTADGTDVSDRLAPDIADNPVLGLGLTQAFPGFNALPNVASEVNGIVRRDSPDDSAGIFPGEEKFDDAFDQSAFDDLIDYRILHIATHGQFVSGNPDDSFLLLGNGDPLKIPEIQTMADLGGIHLAVLSACETAKGGIDKEGIEVSGLSYYFLTQGVKSVAASLWLVNDASTSKLMQRFYANLAAGQSKAEALRQAQLSLIQTQADDDSAADRASVVLGSANGPARAAADGSFSHPYYWAPFILIGNGL